MGSTEWLAERTPRERMIVILGSALGALILLYVLVIEPAAQAIDAREQRVHALRQQSEWMNRVAAEARNLSTQGARTRSGGGRPAYVVVETSLQRSKLPAPQRIAPTSEGDGARLEFEQVPFDALVLWLARVRDQHGLKVARARIERGENGQVRSGLALTRAP